MLFPYFCNVNLTVQFNMSESFRPVSNTPPSSFKGKVKFYGRMVLDLQILTIFRDVKPYIKSFKGNVLDVGCGQSPYKFLLDEMSTKYYGIDIVDANKFDYKNSEITPFNGEDIPFGDQTFDGVICTEVLEHVYNYQKLVNEMYRVMKFGGKGIVTIPWSARYHYIPYDFFRYTPSSLKVMFSQFSKVEIKPRGSDISNIANKLIVIWFAGLIPGKAWRLIFVPIWIVLLPLLGLIVLLTHLALALDMGSKNDPLGYTIKIQK